MLFPPRDRPSNSWWRSWTECCCPSLMRWVSNTLSHTHTHAPTPSHEITHKHAHMLTYAPVKMYTHVFFLSFTICCPDVFSAQEWMCREKNPGFLNSKQQKQNQTVCGCSVQNAAKCWNVKVHTDTVLPAYGSTVHVIDLLVLVCSRTQKFLGFKFTDDSKLLVSSSDAMV